ncbi:hypothetical protein [Spirochaeta africana]|uniref:Uncharacterized protein n=1 Tax=Spirochaeta africana (strain ATCC 700263 / DSM 8902 / Z-7692) TaxID=889378 RepID=H9UMT5_SPIAZ|nr:hypothetical protein [Spirochaeta africana]AFG38828.1 hypothetical protein Spiaf_2804 [Spirochaeta africana DSM 8902]
MNEHLLIMGTRYAPLRELVQGAVDREFPVFTAPTGDREYDDFLQAGPGGVTVQPWRSGSTLSARACVAGAVEAARVAGGQLDSIMLYVSPPSENRGFHEIAPGDLEVACQDVFAGVLFLLREAIGVCMAQGRGTISVVLEEFNQDVLPPLGSGVLYGVQRVVDGCFRAYRNESITLQGLRLQSDQPEQLAQYIYGEYLGRPEKTGFRWTKYTGKSGLFGKKGA